MGRVATTLTGTLLAAAHRSAQAQPDGELDVPYVTTPQNVVDAMLELAQVGPGDRLLDLGSGDGRIVITAARRFGISGLGIEIDPSLVELSRKNAISQGVAERARFVVDDLMTADLSRFNVITMYLLPDVNLLLRPKLRRLPAGTRIVSHDWDMGDWLPERTVEVVAPDKRVGLRKVSRLMRWTV
jgi:SAM-dependent methyltransferase